MQMALKAVVTLDMNEVSYPPRKLIKGALTFDKITLRFINSKVDIRRYVKEIKVERMEKIEMPNTKHCYDIHIKIEGINFKQIICDLLPEVIKDDQSISKILNVIEDEQDDIINSVLSIISDEKKDALVCTAVEVYHEKILKIANKYVVKAPLCKDVKVIKIDVKGA